MFLWGWGLNFTLAKQVLYHLNHISNPFRSVYLFFSHQLLLQLTSSQKKGMLKRGPIIMKNKFRFLQSLYSHVGAGLSPQSGAAAVTCLFADTALGTLGTVHRAGGAAALLVPGAFCIPCTGRSQCWCHQIFRRSWGSSGALGRLQMSQKAEAV
jgi:hypothetical protein